MPGIAPIGATQDSEESQQRTGKKSLARPKAKETLGAGSRLVANLMEARKHWTPPKTGTEKTRAIGMIEQQELPQRTRHQQAGRQADFSMRSETCKSCWLQIWRISTSPDLSLFRPPFSPTAATSIKAVARFAVEAKIKTHSPYPSVSIRLIGTPAQPPSSVDNKALTWHSIYAYGNQVVTANGLAQGETGAKACTQAGCRVHAQAAA